MLFVRGTNISVTLIPKFLLGWKIMNKELLDTYTEKLHKALDHLEYSYEKVKDYPVIPYDLNDESLETWESFSARFSRVSDLFISKYLQLRLLDFDPGFQGSVKDVLNFAEKCRLIEDSLLWMEIRRLRNICSHEYNDEDLQQYFLDLKKYTPNLLAIKKLLTMTEEP